MGPALAKLLAKMQHYSPSKRDIVVSALTTLGVATPLALGREALMEEERLADVNRKAREAARDSTRRMLRKAGMQ